MQTKNAVLLSAVFPLAMLALTASAQPYSSAPTPPGEKACLQSNRLWGFDVVNERTLTVTDSTYKRYTVHMTSGCVGLTKAIQAVALRAKTSLGCMGQGDRVSFINPDLGRLSCVITTVENYAPPVPKEGS